MVAAGEEFHLHEGVAIGALQVGILELRFLGLSPGALGDEGVVEFFVAGEPVRQEGGFRRGFPAAQGPVGLVHGAVPEQGIQPFQGLGRLRQDDDSAHGTVQAVRNAHEDLAGLSLNNGAHLLVRDIRIWIKLLSDIKLLSGRQFRRFDHLGNTAEQILACLAVEKEVQLNDEIRQLLPLIFAQLSEQPTQHIVFQISSRPEFVFHQTDGINQRSSAVADDRAL